MDQEIKLAINSMAISDNLKKKIGDIIFEYQENKSNPMLAKRVDNILESLFKTGFGYSIPMEFIESMIGRVLFQIKLEISVDIPSLYGATECAILSGKSRTMIIRDLEKGRLYGKKISGRYACTENEVLRYLTEVGRDTFSLKEAKLRIERLKIYKEEGRTLKDIKEKFKYKKSWMNPEK